MVNHDENENKREIRVNSLQALFQWASQHGTHSSEPGEQPELTEEQKEKQEFLGKVLKSLTEDVVVRMKNNVDALQLDDDSEDAADKKVDALEDLVEMVEDLNWAQDFGKMGGLHLCSHALRSKHVVVQTAAAECIATTVQNDNSLQNMANDAGILRQVVNLLRNASQDEQLRVKLLRALSCLVTSNVAMGQVFDNLEGGTLIASLLEEYKAHKKTVVKLAFLTSGLIMDFPAFSISVLESNLLEALLNAVVENKIDDAVREQGSRAIRLVCEANVGCHAQLRKKELQAETKLSQLFQSLNLSDEEATAEAKAHIETLQKLLTTEPKEEFNPPKESSDSTAPVLQLGPP
eukprot:m.50135 g.50135  ORF g.50135 m.50135 type:complete len:349 (-) comp10648_c0_seq1:114-1160(-)